MHSTIKAVILGLCLLSATTWPAHAASGDLLWQRRWDGSSHQTDIMSDMATDRSGNVYLCGWTDKDPGPGVDYDALVVKYSASGVRLWSRTWNSGVPNKSEMGQALTCDGAGNVYVTGSSNDLGYDKMILLKYAPAGLLSWTASSDPHGLDCRARDIVALPGGGGWIAGGTATGGSTSAPILWSFTSTGSVANLHELAGTGNGLWNTAAALASDGEDVIMCGISTGRGSSFDMFIEKLDAVGVPIWEKRIDGGRYSGDSALALGVDNADNIYATGFINYERRDVATLKISDDGDLRWMRRYAGSAGGADEGHSIAVSNSSGVIAVTGFTHVSGRKRQALTLRYSSSGALMWARRHPSTSRGNSICIGPGGNIYVAGDLIGSATGSGFLALKYSPLGALRWSRRYNKASAEGDMARKVIANSTGCYVSGVSYSGPGDGDIATLKYVP
jgi:hypothetical protein